MFKMNKIPIKQIKNLEFLVQFDSNRTKSLLFLLVADVNIIQMRLENKCGIFILKFIFPLCVQVSLIKKYNVSGSSNMEKEIKKTDNKKNLNTSIKL